jgi:23S rRNA maturation mini-RNase III
VWSRREVQIATAFVGGAVLGYLVAVYLLKRGANNPDL